MHIAPHSLAALFAALISSFAATKASAQDWSFTPLVLNGDPLPGAHKVQQLFTVEVNNDLDWRVRGLVAPTTVRRPPFQAFLGPQGFAAKPGTLLDPPVGPTVMDTSVITLDNDGGSAAIMSFTAHGVDHIRGVFDELKPLRSEGQILSLPEVAPNTKYVNFFDVHRADGDELIVISVHIDDPSIQGMGEDAIVRLHHDGAGNVLTETLVMRQGTLLPGTDEEITSVAKGLNSFAVNDTGTCFYPVTTKPTSTTYKSYLFLDKTILHQTGDPSPLAGHIWLGFSGSRVALNNAGDRAYTGTIDAGFESSQVLIKNDTLVARQGGPVPGLRDRPIQEFGDWPILLSETGELLWSARWQASHGEPEAAIFLDGKLVVGERLTEIQGKKVVELSPYYHSYTLSDDGRFVAFLARLEDGTEGAFLGTRKGSITALPGCATDGSTLVDVGGAPVIGGSVDLSFYSPSSAPGLRYIALSGTSAVDSAGCGVELRGIGEALIGLTAPAPLLFGMGTYAGIAETVTFPIPNDIDLVGAHVFAQGLFVFPTDPANPFDLTNALEYTIGF